MLTRIQETHKEQRNLRKIRFDKWQIRLSQKSVQDKMSES